MKKTLALICVFAMLFSFCGCRETTVETSVLSYMDGEEVVEGTEVNTVSGENSTQNGGKGGSTTTVVTSKGETTTVSGGDSGTDGDDGANNGGTTNNGGTNNGTTNNGTTNNGTTNNGGTNNNGTTNNGGTNNGTTNNGTTNNGGTTGNTGSNSIIDNPLDVDLKGATITIYDASGAFSANASASKTDKAKADVLAKIQKELNCKFSVKSVDTTKLKSLASTSAASGKAIGGIITAPLYETGYFISANLVANVTRVSSMDLSKSYMNQAGVLNCTQFGAGKYALVGPNYYNAAFGVYYNKRILSELGYDDNYLYDLVNSKKWNYSEYRKLAKEATKDLDGKPGMSENDQWGQVIRDMETGMVADMLVNVGTPMIKATATGLKLNMTDANIIKIANLSDEIYKKDGTRSSANGANAAKLFAAGKAFMFYGNANDSHSLTTMKDEYGYLPTPMVDGQKEYKGAIDWNVGTMMIPAGLSAQDQYNAGAVLQAYLYLYDEIIDTAKKEYVNRYFCDDESGENWQTIIDGITAHPQQCYAKANETILVGTYRVFWNNFSKSASPVSAIESTKVATQKALDDLNRKIKDK